MSTASMSEILSDAQKRGYGIPAFNCVCYEMISWAVEAAQQRRTPVIIQYYPGFANHISPYMTQQIAEAAARSVRVPVVLHLDHCGDIDTIRAMFRYFDSVMVDGSALPYEDNVALTAQVVREAHLQGIFVEAELGHVGSANNADDFTNVAHFTGPAQARDFVSRTQCDALAVSIGNAHGHYVATPNLDINRLDEIRAQIDIPLVLHGGSGIPGAQMSDCVRHGMSKFNVFTDVNTQMAVSLQNAFAQGTKNYYDAIRRVRDEVMAVMLERFDILNPDGVRV